MTTKYTIREEGDANFYSILRGNYWIARIQMNGEMSTTEQRKVITDVIALLTKAEEKE
jgi:hypothetical protein